MAQGVGKSSAILPQTDTFGGHGYGVQDYSGSSSYVQGGDTIDPRVFGLVTIWTLIGGVDQSDTYIAVPRPMSSGVTQWQLVWIVVATGVEVAAGVNLSAYTVRLTAIGK